MSAGKARPLSRMSVAGQAANFLLPPLHGTKPDGRISEGARPENPSHFERLPFLRMRSRSVAHDSILAYRHRRFAPCTDYRY